MKKSIQLITFSLILLIFSSCATIFGGMKTNVKVKGYPEGAKVFYNGNFEGNAPCNVKVSKNSLKDGSTKIQIKAEGFKDSEVTMSRKMKTGAFIGDLFIFPVGHIIDFVTGAIYKPYPNKIEFSLEINSESQK